MDIKKPLLSIIIPCFNERQVLKQSFLRLNNFFKHHKNLECMVVLVNDGSIDDTLSVMNDLKMLDLPANVFLEICNLQKNFGKGAAIQRGLDRVKSDVYVYIDADLSFNFEEVLIEMIEKIERNEADIVIGVRNQRAISSKRKSISKLLSFIDRKIFKLNYKDIQCGFKIFNNKAKNIALDIRQTRFSFDLEFLVMAQKNNLKIFQKDVDLIKTNKTSVSMKDGVRYLLDIPLIAERVLSHNKFIKLYLLVSFGLTFAMFGWILYYGYFFSDDFTWLWHARKIVENKELTIFNARMSTFYSPVINLFYVVWISLFGFNSWIFFLFGLVVHSLVSFFTGLLTKILTKTSLAGLMAVILFSIAGSAYEPLVWIGANMHSIVALFILASFLSYIYSFQSKNNILLLFLSFVFYILALGTKEVAVVFPVILLSSVFLDKEYFKKIMENIYYKLYWLFVMLVWVFYLLNQFLWQKSSVWVQEKIWEINLTSFLKIPLALFNMYFPLEGFLGKTNYLLFFVFSLLFFIYIVYRFCKSKVVLFGFFWSIIFIIPMLFFSSASWWSLIASRYLYTARIGAVILISSIIIILLYNSKYVRVAYNFFWLLIIFSVVQFFFTLKIINTQYAYVYETGRSLHDVANSLKDKNVEKLYVEWYRPFTGNSAYIVGAMDIFAGIKEDKIFFLKKDEKVDVVDDESFVLYWEDEGLNYRIRNK